MEINNYRTTTVAVMLLVCYYY